MRIFLAAMLVSGLIMWGGNPQQVLAKESVISTTLESKSDAKFDSYNNRKKGSPGYNNRKPEDEKK